MQVKEQNYAENLQQIKKMNNKGFTLIELIVGIAIMSVIAIAVMSLMTNGAKTFSSINYYVNLQYESQLAMAQVGEYLIDTQENIGIVEDKLTIDNGLHGFYLDETTNILYYTDDTGEEPSIVAKYVTGFTVDFDSQITYDDYTAVKEITFTLNLERYGKKHEATQTVFLRNEPELIT